MTRIEGPEAIGRAYQDERLANEYLESRYESDDLLKLIHQNQLRILHKLLRSPAPHRVLEIGCGPARITAELPEVQCGIALDQSDAMLRIAEQRLAERNLRGWKLVRGNAFDLEFNEAEFDVVFTFKLLRHFDYAHRQKILKEIRRVIVPNGRLLFDAVNAPACEWLHHKWGLTHSWIDDFHFTPHELCKEMQEQGFRVVHLHPVHRPVVGQYLLSTRMQSRMPKSAMIFANRALNSLPFGMPLEWVAECRPA
jgi:SAM-dependent methyltransferase